MTWSHDNTHADQNNARWHKIFTAFILISVIFLKAVVIWKLGKALMYIYIIFL